MNILEMRKRAVGGATPNDWIMDLDTLVREVHALAREQQTTEYGVPSLQEIRTRLLAGESVAQIVGSPADERTERNEIVREMLGNPPPYDPEFLRTHKKP